MWLETRDRGERPFEICSVPSALCLGRGEEVLSTTPLSVWQAIFGFLSVGNFRSKNWDCPYQNQVACSISHLVV